jgi:hypothetical protein
VLHSAQAVGSYGAARMDVLVIVARHGNKAPLTTQRRDGAKETERLLAPSSSMELSRRVRLRQFPRPTQVIRHLRARLRI